MRVVLDTNTVVSALLFDGIASHLVSYWQSGEIVVLVSREILKEYLRTLSYPKFHLTGQEVKGLIEEEILPFFQTVRVTKHLSVVEKDPDDDKFIECAVAGRARHLVTGDKDLLSLKSYGRVKILSPGDFLRILEGRRRKPSGAR
jgi:hypothetical protein